MLETDKKRVLATAISPYLEGLREEELIGMDSEAMVSLVNLVLHKGSERIVRKTKEQHLEDLVNSVARMNNLGMNPNFYNNVDPILLGLISCQSQTIAEIDELFQFYKAARHGGNERDGKGFFDDVEDFEDEMEYQLVRKTKTWSSDETELREGKGWRDRFRSAAEETYDAYDEARQFVTGEDCRCGYRRGTYCFTQLATVFTACAALVSPDPSDTWGGFALQGKKCFEGHYNILNRCQECTRDACKAAFKPVDKEHHCGEVYEYIKKKIIKDNRCL